MKTRTTSLLISALFLLPACKHEDGRLALHDSITAYLPTNHNEWPDSAGSVESAELAELCQDLWEFKMKSFPTWASNMKDSRYNGNLTDISPNGANRRQILRRGFLTRLRDIELRYVTQADMLTLNLVERDLVNSIAEEERDAGAWNVNPRGGPQVGFLSLPQDQSVDTPADRADLLQRWRSMPSSIRRSGSNLRRAMDAGFVASQTQIEKVLAQLENILATPANESVLVQPAIAGGTWVDLAPGANLTALATEHFGDAARTQELRLVNLHLLDGLTLAKGTPLLLPAKDDLLPPNVRGRFLADVWSTVEDDIYPAFREYRNILRDEVLPNARPDERAGLLFVPGGKAAYAQCIESFTSLPLGAEEIHDIGLAEVERINAEMIALGIKSFGPGAVSDIPSLRAHMAGNPDLHYSSREQIRAMANSAVERSQAALPSAFGKLPAAALTVVDVPAHEEAFTTMAYYRGPAPDGSRPGRYYVNTFDPTSKPMWEAEVLAFHEGVPGHHLQISIANEQMGLPMVRRHMGVGAFVEGWALYTESLADEMGLYSDDLQVLGKLSFDAWRSCRLVVDTGLHSMGWSRDRAIDYMAAHTLGDRRNIENEIDRYIAWPGQALGYKIGQLEILALRQKAKNALGTGFNLSAFHDMLLSNGAVTLPILRTMVDEWIVAMGS